MTNINYFKRALSKSIAVLLIFGCVLFSSPIVLLAEEAALVTDTSASDTATTVADDQTAQPDLQVTPVQDVSAVTDTAATTPPADAASTAENAGTGADSQNDASSSQTTETDVINDNYVQVYNDLFLNADTGNNNANYNTGSGIITTNDARGNGEIANSINENYVQPPTTGDAASGSANAGTGAGSDNTSQANINNQLTIKNINEANVVNRLEAGINSGSNNANYNTGHGMIVTGNASLGLNFFSIANTNIVGSDRFYANWQNIYNSYTGDVDFSAEAQSGSSALSAALAQAANHSTGAESANTSISSVNDQITVTNSNKGKLDNQIAASVTSGKNKANFNNGTGSIATGKANSSVNVMNFLNSNITSGKWMLKTLNVFGSWKGNLKLPLLPSPNLSVTSNEAAAQNASTGAGSENLAGTSTSDSTTITNNNKAVIENTVTMKTNSGANDASYNGGSGIVKIGKAEGETNEMNVANLNVTGDSWWIVVINKFGNWNGTAHNAPSTVVIKTDDIATILTPQSSGVEAQNTLTGPESNNSAGSTVTHSTDILNDNDAQISNTLNISAVSGENEAQKNTGHGYVETGDIRAVNNIMNFANSNITVGNWMVVVVNVFGDWDGDVIFGGGGNDLPVGDPTACPVLGGSAAATSNASAANIATGAGSLNNSSSSADATNTVNNNNNADLGNTASSSATTGQNNANYNTGNAAIDTGQASAGGSIGNQANTNSADTGQAAGTGASSGNGSTGAASANSSDSSASTDTSQTNNNDVDANNNVSGSTNTGQNNSNYNTSDTAIDTSWASTFVGLRNQVNENDTTAGAVLKEFSQTPVAPGAQAQVPTTASSSGTCQGVMIEISPSSYSMAPGGTHTFTALAKDMAGNVLAQQPQFTWTATGGTVTSNGVYTAGNDGGTFAVTAAAPYGNTGIANIVINVPGTPAPPVISGGGGGGSSGGGPVSYGSSGGGGIVLARSRLKGDYNNDGKVNDLDFSILMANWSKKRTGFLAEDTGEGIVNDMDFSLVMSHWTIVKIISSI